MIRIALDVVSTPFSWPWDMQSNEGGGGNSSTTLYMNYKYESYYVTVHTALRNSLAVHVF